MRIRELHAKNMLPVKRYCNALEGYKLGFSYFIAWGFQNVHHLGITVNRAMFCDSINIIYEQDYSEPYKCQAGYFTSLLMTLSEVTMEGKMKTTMKGHAQPSCY